MFKLEVVRSDLPIFFRAPFSAPCEPTRCSDCASPTLKAELSPVAAMSGSPPYGAIISTGEDYYIRASAGLGHAVKFNLSTGMIAELPTPTTSIIFPNWQIGHTKNHKFEPVFTFPEYL
jgi:hypothetical protein